MIYHTRGFVVMGEHVPPFALNPGDWLVLRWPENSRTEVERLLYKTLSGEGVSGAVSCHAGIKVVSPLEERSASLLTQANVGDLLAALPPTEQEPFLAEIRARGLLPAAPIDHLPGTIKRLSQLMLACASAEVVVLDAGGLDPLGKKRICDYVSAQRQRGLAFIELEVPFIGRHMVRPSGVGYLDASAT